MPQDNQIEISMLGAAVRILRLGPLHFFRVWICGSSFGLSKIE